MFVSRAWRLALTFLTIAIPAFSQGNPTGTISGHVTDPSGLAVPDVKVTVAAPVLQGLRTVLTPANGDYIVPFLPPGDYSVKFAHEGFAPWRWLSASRWPMHSR